MSPRPLVEHQREQERQRDGHNSGVKIWSLCSVSSTLSHANLQQLFWTLAIKWEVNIFLKKSICVVYYCVCYHCVGMYPAYICIFLHESEDDYITLSWFLTSFHWQIVHLLSWQWVRCHANLSLECWMYRPILATPIWCPIKQLSFLCLRIWELNLTSTISSWWVYLLGCGWSGHTALYYNW